MGKLENEYFEKKSAISRKPRCDFGKRIAGTRIKELKLFKTTYLVKMLF